MLKPHWSAPSQCPHGSQFNLCCQLPTSKPVLSTAHLQVITAVAAIEFSTRYSKACCKLMVDSSGVSALLAFMRSCNRSKPHVEMLGHALACLANICRCGLGPSVGGYVGGWRLAGAEHISAEEKPNLIHMHSRYVVLSLPAAFLSSIDTPCPAPPYCDAGGPTFRLAC